MVDSTNFSLMWHFKCILCRSHMQDIGFLWITAVVW